MIERRAHPCHKTFIKGRIYFNNRLSSMDCIVRELSEDGCRLEFSENVALPDMFELYLPNKDEYFVAHVIWRRGDNIGISWKPERSVNPRSDHNVTGYHLAHRVARLEHDVAALQRQRSPNRAAQVKPRRSRRTALKRRPLPRARHRLRPT